MDWRRASLSSSGKWENINLIGKKSSARIQHINAGKVVFHGNFLGADMLFDGFLNNSSAFYVSIFGDYHGFMALNNSKSGDNTRRRKLIVVDSISRHH